MNKFVLILGGELKRLPFGASCRIVKIARYLFVQSRRRHVVDIHRAGFS